LTRALSWNPSRAPRIAIHRINIAEPHTAARRVGTNTHQILDTRLSGRPEPVGFAKMVKPCIAIQWN
jgi:hypothetical protein